MIVYMRKCYANYCKTIAFSKFCTSSMQQQIISICCKVKIYYHMDASFVHSDACLIKKPERDYGAEFDALKAENEKFLRL